MTQHPAMHPARRLAAVAVVVAAILGAAPAFAGNGQAGDLEVGLFLGRVQPDDYAPLGPASGGLYGFRLGYAITPAWMVEGSWQRAAGLDGEYAGRDLEVDMEAIRFNFLYTFREGKPLRWFLTGGLGEESVDADDAPMHEVGLGINGGAGIRGYFGPGHRIGWRGTIRVIHTDPGGGVEGSQTNVELTAGIGWAFGLAK